VREVKMTQDQLATIARAEPFRVADAHWGISVWPKEALFGKNTMRTPPGS